MSIPLNGRIAIIDDQFEQALPLIKILSQNQNPHTYFSGDLKFLPKDGENLNDIRVLFLDINLIDNSTHPDKTLKAKLVPVLKRVISTKNFPYAIVYWSRQESEYNDLIKEMFSTDLSDRKPIAFMSATKSDFFEFDGTIIEGADGKIDLLFEKIKDLLDTDPAYSYLLNWENEIHASVDGTLQDVFSSYHEFDDWTNNANYIINKLGISYSGKAFSSQDAEDKIKSSFNALNIVLSDTIENAINVNAIENAQILVESKNTVADNIYSINSKLLLNGEKEPVDYPGAVVEALDSEVDSLFKDILNNSVNRKVIQVQIESSNPDKEAPEIQKLTDKEAKRVRGEIRETWKKIYFSVTPLCDYVQNKADYNRCVHGMLIEADKKEFIDDKSEAIFVSPTFSYENVNYVLVLHFRYFFTVRRPIKAENLNSLFRVRLQLLSEVQSKLARHVSRQGILFLDER